MAQFIFLNRIHLRCCTTIFWYIKDWIISKSILPCNLMPDLSFDHTAYRFYISIWENSSNSAYKSSGTLFIWYPF